MSWVLGLGEHARLLDPSELGDEAVERLATIVERHAEPEPDFVAEPAARRRAAEQSANGHQADGGDGPSETPIRPERFARLVALAGILIQSRAATRGRGSRTSASGSRSPTRSCARTSTC